MAWGAGQDESSIVVDVLFWGVEEAIERGEACKLCLDETVTISNVYLDTYKPSVSI
jgi:hypothetical protein